ncbi:hypothetical protein PROFUN_13686 [Planoprotostelium fungivorum]|uniref:Uncharacterized protein n=1 Tax=Planoprotostelium fungivorum TaxID=1890364 RepID=A0A2P6N3E0_9EUKA|nr:hypothetical protein PROFUN_13686 [Planoprotostelium fungivorum]
MRSNSVANENQRGTFVLPYKQRIFNIVPNPANTEAYRNLKGSRRKTQIAGTAAEKSPKDRTILHGHSHSNMHPFIDALLQQQRAATPVLNVIIIGGSSGIGVSIVKRFAEAGHRVLSTYYSNMTGALDVHKAYPHAEYVFLDQGDLESIETFAHGGMQKVDVLVNNAALGSATVINYVNDKLQKSGGDIKTISTLRRKALEDEALMKVNSLGPLWITDVITPLLRGPATSETTPTQPVRNYSTIIYMGSVGGSTGVFPEYRASDLMSKAAVTYLSKHIAAEQVRSHVDVFCLAPGATMTEMFRKSTLETCSDPKLFTSMMPKQRLIETKELADATFVLSTEPWARIFHGAVLDASLGLGIRPGLQTENTMGRT